MVAQAEHQCAKIPGEESYAHVASALAARVYSGWSLRLRSIGPNQRGSANRRRCCFAGHSPPAAGAETAQGLLQHGYRSSAQSGHCHRTRDAGRAQRGMRRALIVAHSHHTYIHSPSMGFCVFVVKYLNICKQARDSCRVFGTPASVLVAVPRLCVVAGD